MEGNTRAKHRGKGKKEDLQVRETIKRGTMWQKMGWRYITVKNKCSILSVGVYIHKEGEKTGKKEENQRRYERVEGSRG